MNYGDHIEEDLVHQKILLVKIDLATGDTTNIGQTGFAVNTVDMEFDENGILYGVKGSGTTICELFSIDTLSGVGTLIGLNWCERYQSAWL